MKQSILAFQWDCSSCQAPNLKKFQLAWPLCNQSVSFKLRRKQEATTCELPSKITEDREEATLSLALAKDIRVDAVVAAVLPELDCIFTLKEEQ